MIHRPRPVRIGSSMAHRELMVNHPVPAAPNRMRLGHPVSGERFWYCRELAKGQRDRRICCVSRGRSAVVSFAG
jgi:hypothetical protein